jgi:hypothetical protein
MLRGLRPILTVVCGVNSDSPVSDPGCVAPVELFANTLMVSTLGLAEQGFRETARSDIDHQGDAGEGHVAGMRRGGTHMKHHATTPVVATS